MQSEPIERSPNDTSNGWDWVPPWTRMLGMPVWICGIDGTIRYLNGHAEELLGKTLAECRGRPCHSVINARKPSGEIHCVPDCPVVGDVIGQREIEPLKLRIVGSDGSDRWIWVVVIAVHPAGDPEVRLVHCVINDEIERRFNRYLTKIFARAPLTESPEYSLEKFHLTRREAQVLRLLSEDECLHSIAEKLNVSYATVRNHVHHVFNKLSVHSIMEAVALYLLSKED